MQSRHVCWLGCYEATRLSSLNRPINAWPVLVAAKNLFGIGVGIIEDVHEL